MRLRLMSLTTDKAFQVKQVLKEEPVKFKSKVPNWKLQVLMKLLWSSLATRSEHA